MPTLNVYDKFGELLECHEFEGSLVGWFENNLSHYKKTTRPPYTAELNGKPWAYVYHGDDLSLGDVVDLTIEPATGYEWIYWVIAAGAAAYSYYVANNLPQNYERSTPESGQSIYNVNARANTVKPSGVIRESAGKYPIYPDLICPVRRKYINHEEYLYLMMCVSSGYMYLKQQHIYIAETPIINYFGDYTLSIFEPGDDVSSNEAHENWFESKEVLDLKLTTSGVTIPGNWTATYTSNTITTYLDGVETTFPMEVDTVFTLSGGSNAGVYRVDTIGSPNSTATVVKQALSDPDRIRINFTSSQVNSANNNITQDQLNQLYADSTASPQTSLTPASPAESVSFRIIRGASGWQGPFEIIPTNETARYMEVDVNFPGGLVELDSNNEESDRTVEIEIEYRAVGSQTWILATDTSRSPNATSYTARTFDERGYTVEIDFGSEIRPEVRFRRVTQDADSVTISDEVFIKRVRCLLETPTSYDDVTTMGLILRGTNTLARSAENQINIRGAIRKLPTIAEVQAAAGGTAFDLSASNTETESLYRVTSDASFLGASNLNSDDFYPASAGTANSVYVEGERLLTYENGILRGFTFSGDPTNNLTYVSASSNSPTSFAKNAMFRDSGTKVYLMYKISDPSTDMLVRQFDLSTAYNLDTMGSVNAEFQASSEITDGECFYINEAGTRFWIADGSGKKIVQYSCTAHDLSTAAIDTAGTSPDSNVELDVSTELNSASPNSNLASFWMSDEVSGQPTKLWVMSSDGTIYHYTMTTTATSLTASYVDSVTLPASLSSRRNMQVTENYLFVCSYPSETFVHSWLLDTIVESRSSRSICRFVANMLYESFDTEVENIIDWTTLSSLDTTLEAREDYFDGEFVDETTLWEAIKTVFAPGYTEPAMKEGKITPVRIAAGSDYDQLYTPDTMINEGLAIADDHYDGVEPDGIDVEYLDEDSGEMEVVECRLSGDSGLRAKRIQVIGITNRTRAWRYGMRERRMLRYKPAQYSFSTEMHGFSTEYGDAIAIASDLFGSQSGTVTAASGANITLDFIPEYVSTSPETQYYAAFKDQEGNFKGLYTISQGSPNNVIVITSSPGLDFTPVTDASADSEGDNTLVTIGMADDFGVRAIVRNVTPRGAEEVEIVAMEYLADLYASDNDSPP